MGALAYKEPYKFSAGLLTLLAHTLFFSVLYFGVNWSVQQPQGMEVDLWANLPETDNLSPPVTPPAEMQPASLQKVESAKPKEVEKPAPTVKAEIDMTEKKKKPLVKPKQIVKPEPRKKLTESEQNRAQKEMQELINQQEPSEQQERARRAEHAAQAAAGAAAITGEVEKYKGLIGSKIRHNIVNPPDVANDAEAVFVVTLIPGGDLLEVKLLKSSGNAAYDDAVERAIRKAVPLPLPQDEAARKQFINPNQLKFKFSPTDKE